MELETHDEHAAVSVTLGPRLVAEAHKCPIVADHWWLTRFDADGEIATATLTCLAQRLRERHGINLSVAPKEVRPDMGRDFFREVGFGRSPSDLSNTSPLELSLTS